MIFLGSLKKKYPLLEKESGLSLEQTSNHCVGHDVCCLSTQEELPKWAEMEIGKPNLSWSWSGVKGKNERFLTGLLAAERKLRKTRVWGLMGQGLCDKGCCLCLSFYW